MPTSRRGKQRPGAACDECRRRKLRCDRQKPQCAICRASGAICDVTQRGTRGPKKGDLTTLRNRVVELEALLESQQPQEDSIDNSKDITLPTPAADGAPPWFPVATASIPEPEILFAGLLPDGGASSEWSPNTLPLVSNPRVQITSVMHAELDQLYFDRVHPSIPIIHQRRYLSWSKSSIKTPSRSCLQYAMWTLATLLSLSTQLRDMTEFLYREAKQKLESLSIEGNENSNSNTEIVQTWVLIAMCESMRTHHQQAWLSAGRAFRLMQGLRFHEIDSPSRDDGRDWIETEEKRRVFWMAYFLDHLFSIRNDWPVTLNEHVICTRLPALDPAFQNGQQILGSFLSEAMTDASPKMLSPFNECLILVTICGRNLLRGQQNNISKVYGDMALGGTGQAQWLDSILSTRRQVLSQYYLPPTEAFDPMLWFANILSHTAIVYQYSSLIKSTQTPMNPPDQVLTAIATMIDLAKALCELHFSKVHPLMPLPLFLTAEFLYDNHSGGLDLHLKEMADILKKLRNVNNPEQSYVDLLPQSCISKSIDLLHGVKDY